MSLKSASHHQGSSTFIYPSDNNWKKNNEHSKSPVMAMVKVKVQCALVQALMLCTRRTAHRGSRSIALLFLAHGTKRDECLAARSGRTLPPGETRYPLHRRLCGPQGRPGQVRKISPPTAFDPQTVQPAASRYPYCATRSTVCRRRGLGGFPNYSQIPRHRESGQSSL